MKEQLLIHVSYSPYSKLYTCIEMPGVYTYLKDGWRIVSYHPCAYGADPNYDYGVINVVILLERESE